MKLGGQAESQDIPAVEPDGRTGDTLPNINIYYKASGHYVNAIMAQRQIKTNEQSIEPRCRHEQKCEQVLPDTRYTANHKEWTKRSARRARTNGYTCGETAIRPLPQTLQKTLFRWSNL